jgi:hypothetical protein
VDSTKAFDLFVCFLIEFCRSGDSIHSSLAEWRDRTRREDRGRIRPGYEHDEHIVSSTRRALANLELLGCAKGGLDRNYCVARGEILS